MCTVVRVLILVAVVGEMLQYFASVCLFFTCIFM